MTQQQTGGVAAPLSRTWELANGMQARFEMPDMLQFATGAIEIPNDAQAAVYELLYGSMTEVDPLKQLAYDRTKLKGLYYLFSIVCVEPRVVIDDEDRQPGEIGPRQIAFGDLTAAHNFFRFGPPAIAAAAEDPKPPVAPGS